MRCLRRLRHTPQQPKEALFKDRAGKPAFVKLIKVNCVDFEQACHSQRVAAYTPGTEATGAVACESLGYGCPG